MMPLAKPDEADLPIRRFVNDALTVPDNAPDVPQQILRPWPSDKQLPKVNGDHHLVWHHLDDQVVTLETRVKYDKGLVDAVGGHLEVSIGFGNLCNAGEVVRVVRVVDR